MSFDDTTEFLARAARRAARGPAPLIAGLIEAWRKAFPKQAPEESLGCSAGTLTDLALCLRPRDQHWVKDATEVADALAVNADRLIDFLRAAEAIQSFGDAHPAEAFQEGGLLAARDRDEDE
jgi:hypothetical protein